MDDSQIIDLFFARSELAISELDAKYGKVCHKLAHNILDSRQDAEECVNDAYTWARGTPFRRSGLIRCCLSCVSWSAGIRSCATVPTLL